MKRYKIAVMITMIATLLCGCSVGHTKESSVYTDKIKNGYTIVEDVKQTRFAVPSALNKAKSIGAILITDELDESKAQKKVNQTSYIGFRFDSMIVATVKTEMTGKKEIKSCAKEFETLTNIRLDGYENDTVYEDNVSKIKKENMEATAEVLLTQQTFDDFTGYFSIIQKDNTVCMMFVGTRNNGKSTLTSKDLNYMINTFHYYDFTTDINSDKLVKSNNEIDGQEISKESTVDIDQYGFFDVLNKTNDPKEVKIAGKVTDVLSGGEAQEKIKENITDTIYKELPDPDMNMQWACATVSYNGVTNSFKKVPPFINVIVLNDEGEAFNSGSDTYTLQTDYKNNAITVFYQVPVDTVGYQLVLGDAPKKLTVNVK